MGDKKQRRTRVVKPTRETNKTIQNTFGGYAFSGLPFVGAQGGGSAQTVSDANALFSNLRWYQVSNFRQLISELYVEIGLVQTVVNVPIDDALKGGILLKSQQLDEDQIQEVKQTMDMQEDLHNVGQGKKWARCFGGGGVLILVDDQDPEESLDIPAIGPDSEIEFRPVDMWELFFDKLNTEYDAHFDPFTEMNHVECYNYRGKDIHHSRVIKMVGQAVPSFIRPRLRGWGLSYLDPVVRSVNQYLKATDVTYQVLDEFKIDVYKLKNLVNTYLSAQGNQKVQQTIAKINALKNYQNAVVLDSEDDWIQRQLSFDGLDTAFAGIRKQLAAELRMPITKLFGSSDSGGGLANGDQNDMENYNSMLEGDVRFKLKPAILKVAQIRCQQLFQFIPDDLEIEFKPLRELTAEQEENVKTQKFTRLLSLKQAGEISTIEFRDAINKGALVDVKLDTSDAAISAVEAEAKAILEDKDTGEQKEEPKKNSIAFDLASYEADGGDSQYDSRRFAFFEDPVGVDEALWIKSKKRSKEIYGQENWKYTLWLYEKSGGVFK